MPRANRIFFLSIPPNVFLDATGNAADFASSRWAARWRGLRLQRPGHCCAACGARGSQGTWLARRRAAFLHARARIARPRTRASLTRPHAARAARAGRGGRA